MFWYSCRQSFQVVKNKHAARSNPRGNALSYIPSQNLPVRHHVEQLPKLLRPHLCCGRISHSLFKKCPSARCVFAADGGNRHVQDLFAYNSLNEFDGSTAGALCIRTYRPRIKPEPPAPKPNTWCCSPLRQRCVSLRRVSFRV